MKILIAITVTAFIALWGAPACKEDKGLHTGATLQDCGAIAPHQREEAARAIKGQNKEDAIRTLAAKYGATPEAAAQCLK